MHISNRTLIKQDFASRLPAPWSTLSGITGTRPFIRRRFMKLMTVLTLSSLAALAVGESAFAENATPASAQHLTSTVYQGVDTDGKRVKLTISDAGPEVLIRVDRQPALPAPHWTALIGTGGAAAIER
jgi:hypothetical protein